MLFLFININKLRFWSNYYIFMKIKKIMEEFVRIEKQLQLLKPRLNKLNLLKILKMLKGLELKLDKKFKKFY